MESEPDSTPRAPDEAKTIGRYRCSRALGSGGTGIVYAAYDPQLDRRVALKLLHAGAADSAALRARLLKEAQAMARLTHPNVALVHDVGESDGRIFVAMELVEGTTLAQWMKGARPWREVVRLFVLAGRGLAAAHRAQVVHRDFKPENVLIGSDGSVRVTDFGLARSEERADAWNSLAGTKVVAASWTTGGELWGSPAYMAPEQMRGERSDARADQFSFAVALYEGLYGERPFAGDELRTLRESIEQNRVRPAPAGSRVPARVRRAVLRGLAPRAEDRHPSLEEMLRALESDPAARQKRAFAALALLLLAGLGGALFVKRANRASAERACHGAEGKLAHVWDGETREKARASFAGTGLPYAAAAFSSAQKALDSYAAAWVAQRVDACEATSLRREQPPALLDLRMGCLDDRLRGIAAASALFTAADADIVKKAPDLVAGLPPLATCADARALREPNAPTPAQEQALSPLRDQLAGARALSQSGKQEKALAALQALQPAAHQLGYAPFEAESLLELGLVQGRGDDLPASQRTLEQAAAAGLLSRSDAVVATAWTQLINLHVIVAQLEQAALAAEQAKAAVARLGADRHAQAELAISLGRLSRRTYKFDEARRQGERAVALSENEPLLRIHAFEELSNDLLESGQTTQALAPIKQALALASEVYGDAHPLTGKMEAQLSFVEAQTGQSQSARAHAEHALAVLEKANGPEHSSVADVLQNLALIMTDLDPAQAIGYAQRAIRIFSRGPVTSDLLNTMTMLGNAYEAVGEHESARKELEETLALAVKTNPDPDDMGTATIRQSLGEVLIAEGRTREARALLTAALASQERVIGDESSVTAQTMFDVGKLERAEKHFAQARRWMERSIAPDRLDGKDNSDSLERELQLAELELREDPSAAIARVERIVALPVLAAGKDALFDVDRARFLLARARWAAKQDLPRARSLAEAARDGYAARGEAFAAQRAEIETWLASTDRLAHR